MLRVITETDRQEALVEREQEEYVVESSKSGIGTIVLNKGEIMKHEWSRKDNIADYVTDIGKDTAFKERIDNDFSFVEIKLVYSYENYVKFLEERGVTV